jgi:hypothetical protein
MILLDLFFISFEFFGDQFDRVSAVQTVSGGVLFLEKEMSFQKRTFPKLRPRSLRLFSSKGHMSSQEDRARQVSIPQSANLDRSE